MSLEVRFLTEGLAAGCKSTHIRLPLRLGFVDIFVPLEVRFPTEGFSAGFTLKALLLSVGVDGTSIELEFLFEGPVGDDKIVNPIQYR